MQVTRLEASGLRRFEHVALAPEPGLNLITGDNGAGKTSLLEALHPMAYGRSFRGRVRDGLVRTRSEAVEVFVEWREAAQSRVRRAGLRHCPRMADRAGARSRGAGNERCRDRIVRAAL